jgi:hypothetical protein
MSRSRQPASLGGTFARAALGLVREGARELRAHGRLRFASVQIAGPDPDALFSRRLER